MGKKKITEAKEEVKKDGAEKKVTAPVSSVAPASPAVSSKKKIEHGILYVQSTYNNTKLLVTDNKGNALLWNSAGSSGFSGAKKGTPFAAAKIGEALGEKARDLGIKEIAVVVRGVGSGRESSIRGFVSKGINITGIKDVTPVPHNGPRPPRPRRV